MRKKLICLMLSCCLFGSVAVYAADADERLDALRPGLAQVRFLLEECETLGIDVGYERVDYGVIRDFMEYGKQDTAWGDTERAGYVADTLERLLQEVTDKLNAYRSGAAAPYPVVRNVPENYGGVQNGNFVRKDGTPIISNGFGVFEQLKNDIPKMQEFGADLVQIEIGPSNVLVPQNSINGWGCAVYGGAQATAVAAEQSGRNGNFALKIVNGTTADNAYLAVNQNVSVKPNTTYTLTFYARTENGGAFTYGMQGWKAPRTRIANGTQPWTQYSAAYTTGAEEYNLEILFVSSAKSDAIYLDDISIQEDGKNIIQNGDFEDSDGMKSEHFQANTMAIRDKVTRVLDRAEANDVMVNVLISPHYFPNWILEKYPQAKQIDCGLGYDINNSIVQEALELYVNALMQEIKTHPALHSICLTNEPKCVTRNQEELQPAFAAYLAEVHNSDISLLNSIYETNYQTFAEVPMPAGDTMDAAYYDWVQFNNQYTAAWHRYLAELVKKYAPNVAVHAKIMTIFGNSDSLNYGIDPEDFAEFTDYSGHDAWGFYGKDASGLISKLAWYDLLKSIKPESPVINSEDHIIEDRNTNYTEKQAAHVAADIWQGAVHGRDASIIWIWGRTQDKTANTYGNILYRPDVLSAVGKNSLDLNRLSEQVASLQKAENKVTILYSPTSRAYLQNTVRTLLYTYESALYAGANPKFITERQLAAGVKPEGTLILPEVRNVSANVYAAIENYQKQGGKLLALGEECLLYDEYNRACQRTIDFNRTVSITRSGTVISKPTKAELQLQIVEMTGITDFLRDADGKAVTGVERIEQKTAAGSLWNLCNYTWETSKQVCFEGKAVDLLTGTIYEGKIELQPFVPVLLEFGSIKDAEFIGVAAQNGREIVLELKNQGDMPDFLNGTIRIQNEDNGEVLTGIHFSKYLSGHSQTRVKYHVAVPEGNYAAIINGRYADGKKQLAELWLSLK